MEGLNFYVWFLHLVNHLSERVLILVNSLMIK